jgi:hypothetical protein
LITLGVSTLIALAAAAPVAAPVRVHAIVVGVNKSPEDGVAPLQFADDDAARYAELFATSDAADVRALIELDADEARFPSVASSVRAPTTADLTRAFDESFAALAADRKAGIDGDLVFVYVGHGAVDEHGEGWVTLLDGKLTRSALFALLDKSPARYNHVIVDACSAWALMNRGAAAPAEVVAHMLDQSTLASHQTTGVVLATSGDRATHEWGRVGGGVFSHELLSALAGAADVDGDGFVRYDEIGAFLEAANAEVADPRAHVAAFVRAPALAVDRPLWRLSSSPHLSFSAGVGHAVVVDARGVIIAELNEGSEVPVELALPGRAPFIVETAAGDRTTEGAGDPPWSFDQLPAPVEEKDIHARSAISSALERGLFQTPFGLSFVKGYRAGLRAQPPPAPSSRTDDAGSFDLLPAVVGAGVAVVVVGAAVAGAALWMAQPSLGVLDKRTKGS